MQRQTYNPYTGTYLGTPKKGFFDDLMKYAQIHYIRAQKKGLEAETEKIKLGNKITQTALDEGLIEELLNMGKDIEDKGMYNTEPGSGVPNQGAFRRNIRESLFGDNQGASQRNIRESIFGDYQIPEIELDYQVPDINKLLNNQEIELIRDYRVPLSVSIYE